ncbi:uncharacterized protein LOC130518658 isoform X2 [Takifugu flavidus]|uniref:Homeobox protein NOBOX Homeodomain-containing protein OG-2 n=2 Tax=Takifugu flavidus TaxID=433684 RepID=A0A5C6NCH2_9TELE|nr:uncharacterized protein LOC130518658 isoform X2 [Takifugu flavidus]TWW65182.1 Homeobox protein NOBOX Homeodomain-containing protein OG-2 [Takifugu flavidus]
MEEEVQVLQQRDGEEAAHEVVREEEQEVKGMKAESNMPAPEAEDTVVRQEVGEAQVDEGFENNQGTETREEEKDRKSSDERDEKKRSRKRKGRKLSERGRNRKCFKRVSEQQEEKNTVQTREMLAVSSEDSPALSEPPVGVLNSCDLSDPLDMGSGVTGPPVPTLCSSQPPVSIQPALPQLHGTKRPLSPLLPHTLPQPRPQPLEMEITQVYSTRRSIRYSTRGRGRALNFSLLPGLDVMDCLQPLAPKKKSRTLYSTDQLEHLEGLFQEDHYPDAEKRKAIAASVGVTPQRIMVWFQNRRAKWRKAERSQTAKADVKQTQVGCSSGSPHQQRGKSLPKVSKAVPSFSGHYGNKPPQLSSAVPSFPTLSSQTFPSYSNLLPTITSPAQSQVRDGGQNQISSQGVLAEYQPRPMHSPPPLRRASLPLFQTNYNPANPTPPLHNALAHTPPLFLDASEGGSSLHHRDSLLSLQTDTSSLFDFGEKFDYLTSSQQNNSLQYQFQSAYPTSQPQPQHQPQPSISRMTYLTPSPYLTPNAPESNPTSYLTFGPGGNSASLMTYSTGGHAYFQSQNTGQILLQSAGHHGGMAAYQSYPWGNMYSQTAIQQHAPCPPTFTANLGGAREHQPPASTTLPPLSFFPLGDPVPSLANPQGPSHAQTHTSSCTTTTSSAALPPVSTLRPPRLRAEITPTTAASLLPSQTSPASPESPPVPPCVKIEYDSPQEIHSHFHCDFSSIHF